MLKRTFDPSTDSDSDQEAIDSALESGDDCEDRDSAEDEDQPNSGPMKRARSTKHFSKVDECNHNDMYDTYIMAHIRNNLLEFNFPIQQAFQTDACS